MKNPKLLLAVWLVVIGIGSPTTTFAVWQGPAGASCSGTRLNGESYSGTQAWSNSNNGYWTCCLKGTSCYAAKINQPRDHGIEVRAKDGAVIVIPRPAVKKPDRSTTPAAR